MVGVIRKEAMPVTIKEILIRINSVKPCSKRQVFRYLNKAKVKPIGRITRPRLYPDRAPEQILEYLGLGDIPSMNQLRAARRKSLKAHRRAA